MDDTRGLGSDGDGGNKGGSNGDGDDSKKIGMMEMSPKKKRKIDLGKA